MEMLSSPLQTLHLNVYYDITCPYCCVAHRRLKEIIAPTLKKQHGINLSLKVKSHQLISSLPSGNSDPNLGPVAPPVNKIEFLSQFLGGAEGVRKLIRDIEVDSRRHGVELVCLDGGLACNSANAHRLLYILGKDCKKEGESLKQAVLMKRFYRYFELGEAPTVANLKGAVQDVINDLKETFDIEAFESAVQKWFNDTGYCKSEVQNLLNKAPPKVLGKGVPYAVISDTVLDISTETTNAAVIQNLLDIALKSK